MKKYIKTVISIAAVFAIVTLSAFILKKAYNNYLYSTYPIKYEDCINKASEKYNVPKALIYSVIKTESGFDPEAESNAGAVGLMQITNDTFVWLQTFYKDENNYTFEDLTDPDINIDYGVHILSILSDMYEDEATVQCRSRKC